jgi:sterol desaturase/sphingolipid hydroxylase (fatty acid hydroxylase superfamily)
MVSYWITPAVAVILCIVWFFERKFPATEQPIADVILDWKLATLHLVINKMLLPIAALSAAMIVNATGGGWVHLRSDGWWFLVSIVMIVLVTDLVTYLLHRAMHEIPVLWAMHSLHHSAETLTIITGARHFWLEDPISTAILPVLPIIFQVPPEVVTIVVVLYFVPEGLVHMNVRLSLGRFALVLNNPQYHRIHHSVEPQHWNKNFCKMLPLFDVIFGTAWKPGKDEFPATGLAGETATGFLDGMIWPVRHRLSWVRARTGDRLATGDVK